MLYSMSNILYTRKALLRLVVQHSHIVWGALSLEENHDYPVPHKQTCDNSQQFIDSVDWCELSIHIFILRNITV